MGLKDYFDMGRKQEIEYERKQQSKRVVKKVKKPSPWSPAGIIIGAGVMYQILHPYLTPVGSLVEVLKTNVVGPTVKTIKNDFMKIFTKVRKVKVVNNPEWEKYSRFEELAKGDKKE